MDEAAEAGKSIRKVRRSFANYKTKMTSLRRPDGTVAASQRATEKVIYDFTRISSTASSTCPSAILDKTNILLSSQRAFEKQSVHVEDILL
ncbi:hypothetical protein V3C99_017792 [Haemonchus contortus]|uniref:Uncharacterized protein n=1 Tax=Haemonchus contortus TaxID=6289 RepID=A0A7I5EEP0_HAECO